MVYQIYIYISYIVGHLLYITYHMFYDIIYIYIYTYHKYMYVYVAMYVGLLEYRNALSTAESTAVPSRLRGCRWSLDSQLEVLLQSGDRSAKKWFKHASNTYPLVIKHS